MASLCSGNIALVPYLPKSHCPIADIILGEDDSISPRTIIVAVIERKLVI